MMPLRMNFVLCEACLSCARSIGALYRTYRFFRFRAFGTLRYVRITMDPITARSRGTAFACFWKREDADKAIRQSELLNREAGADVRYISCY